MILDKKSEEELEKHKNNFYLETIESRTDILEINNIDIFNPLVDNIVFKVNIKKFSSIDGSYYYSGNDPLVNTSKELLKSKTENISYNESYLYKYYNAFQPKTHGEVFNLKKENKLHTIESTNTFYPWIHEIPTNKFRAGLFGPKDITNVKHRIIRLKNIINNIEAFGYIPSKNDIVTGYILLKKDDYRFLITGGHHRVAVMTAMNMLNKELFNEVIHLLVFIK